MIINYNAGAPCGLGYVINLLWFCVLIHEQDNLMPASPHRCSADSLNSKGGEISGVNLLGLPSPIPPAILNCVSSNGGNFLSLGFIFLCSCIHFKVAAFGRLIHSLVGLILTAVD